MACISDQETLNDFTILDKTPAAIPVQVPVREAVEAEICRMPVHVLWFYQRGQPVVLWLASQRLSLMPLSLPAGEVTILQRDPPGQGESTLRGVSE